MSFHDPELLVPAGLVTEAFVLRPITAADAQRDHAAVMETRDELRLWEQSAWPEDDFTVEANRADLIDLERRHTEHRAFTYTVLAPVEDEVWGCVYVFPITATFLTKATVRPVAEDRWEDVDAVVYFWLRSSRAALAPELLSALRAWFPGEWAFETTVFVTNEQYVDQARLLDGTDLTVRFELREPGKPGTYLVYG